MQKTAGFYMGDYVVAFAVEGEFVQGFDGGFGLAGGGAEGGEIVVAEQELGGAVHGGFVQRSFDVPDAVGLDGRPGGAV